MVAQLPDSIWDSCPNDHLSKRIVLWCAGERESDVMYGWELFKLHLLGYEMNETMQRDAGHDVDEKTVISSTL